MKTTYGRVALATVLAGFVLTATASADTLELTADQPTIAGSLDSGLEGQAKAGPATGGTAVYIVQLGDPALAMYDGGIGKLKATSNRMTGNRRLNVNSKNSKAYSKYLKKSQAKMVAACEVALGHDIDVRYDYQAVFNGVAMVLTEEEANVVAAAAGVKNVSRERIEVPLTDAGPQWIGAPSIWTGPPNNVDHSRGEGIVIAVLDTGINHDHPSYADIGGDGFDHTNPLGSGNFIPGSYCDLADPSFCNDKLIGAWTFVAEAVTPEDSDGHGSHTSSTAGGNVIPSATLFAPTTQLTSSISGVAPHANIIMYDVCIVTCPGAALLAAINQVVLDASNLPNGIHSLNYSISGGGNPYNDPVELGFLAATAAGVYVSASAGNSGPGAATVAHLGPWVSTTGASTHDRVIENSVVDLTSDADPLADIVGAGFTSGFGPATIINSADLEGAFPGSTLCGLGGIGDLIPPWPPGTFNGEIVACTRGTFGRVEKGANVLSAGAGGYILMDNGGGIVGDAHVLPGVHITQADGGVLAAWLAANPNPTGSITGFTINLDASNGDIMAGFSSRGPNNAFGVLKPDLSAPGVGIFAADSSVTNPFTPPESQFLSGTSMSSPHNAGSGALLSAVQPDWTPYEVKSALMMTSTTDNTLKEDGATPTDHFDLGAGRIDLTRASEAGLILDETPANFAAADPALGGDPKTLNLASMQDNTCVESCSWTRTVRNPDGHTSHWNLSANGPAGLGLTVSPDRLMLKAGESANVSVDADTALASSGWNFAQLDMERDGDGPDLHMPIAVFATNSSNPDLLNKTVDAATAAEDEPLNYEITITNGQVVGQINLTDVLPDGLDFVSGSETEVVIDGTTISPFSEGGGTLTWSGTLDPGSLQLTDTGPPAPLGFFSISFIDPFGCPSNCDDGGFIVNVPSFVYNGQTHSQVILSVNGTLEAGSASGQTSSFANQNMPDSTPPNNLMAPFWTDLNMGADGDGAEWFVGVFNLGPNQFTIYEWNNIPLFGDLTRRYTFQIWVQNGPSGNIWYTYGQLDDVFTPSVTVGVEDAAGSIGSSYFFDGAGTAPALLTDLMVEQVTGGTATFTFQAEIDDCENGEAIVNRATLSGATDETAIAVTQCVDGDEDNDSDSDSD
ncbi:MAG: S8 family serine peptidase [Proteobacteria bacterium]|nr:S8 family serine peptidase [Pseudomonadota bacterium]